MDPSVGAVAALVLCAAFLALFLVLVSAYGRWRDARSSARNEDVVRHGLDRLEFHRTQLNETVQSIKDEVDMIDRMRNDPKNRVKLLQIQVDVTRRDPRTG